MNKYKKPVIVTFFLIYLNSVNSQTCNTNEKRFVKNTNATVTDKTTNLMWQKCQLGFSGDSCEIGSVKTYNWQQATDKANLDTLADYSDWRLPKKDELIGIVNKTCGIPSINSHYFPHTSNINFWSANLHEEYPKYAWKVGFTIGHVTFGKLTNYGGVRLVRSIN